jgi:hypothetical protein
MEDAKPLIRARFIKIAVLVKNGVPFDYLEKLDDELLQMLYEAFQSVFQPNG